MEYQYTGIMTYLRTGDEYFSGLESEGSGMPGRVVFQTMMQILRDMT